MLVRLAGVRAYGQGLHCFEILRGQLDEAESLNIVNAVEWLERGRLGDVYTVKFYKDLHLRMYDLVRIPVLVQISGCHRKACRWARLACDAVVE